MPKPLPARILVLIGCALFCSSAAWCAKGELPAILDKAKAASLAGDLNSAEALVNQALQILTEDKTTSASMQSYAAFVFGEVYRRQNRLGQALDSYMAAYRIANRPDSRLAEGFRLMLCGRLGEASIGAGKHEEAENTMRSCLQERAAPSAGFNADENYAKGVFVSVLLANRKEIEAETVSRTLLAGVQKAFAANSMEAAIAMRNLSRSIRSQEEGRKISEARQLMVDALKICQTRSGADDQQCIDFELDLAEIEMSVHGYALAEQYASHALAVRKKTLGDRDPLTGRRHSFWARLISTRGVMSRHCLSSGKSTPASAQSTDQEVPTPQARRSCWSSA